jgi:hypothetical protein
MFPGVAVVVMIIIFVIITLLRYGPQICKVRHHTLPDREREDLANTGYAQSVSYDV